MMNFVSGSLFSSYMAFLVLYSDSGVDEFRLRFILFPRHELCGDFRVLFCRFSYIGFVYPVLLRRCSSLDLVIHGCALSGSSSNRMSTRRLPVITLYFKNTELPVG